VEKYSKKKSLKEINKGLKANMMPIEEYTNIITQSMMLSHLYGRDDMNTSIGEMRSKDIDLVEMSEAPDTSASSVSKKFPSSEGKSPKVAGVGAFGEHEGEVFAEIPDPSTGSGSEQFAEIPDAYTEAVKFFLAKNIITKKEFEKLEKKIRKHAFTVAKTDSEWLISKMKDSIQTALAEGIPTADWLAGIDSVFESAGMTKLNDYHLRTIFRTNMQTALNEGKMAIIQQADTEEFPLLEFVAIEDDRVRGSHLKLDGYRAPKNDAVWQSLTPPLDYNCRCTLRPVHVNEGLKATKKPDIKSMNLGFVKN
jgi:SPP1 gp7 family putative phage head morphogenesis protein